MHKTKGHSKIKSQVDEQRYTKKTLSTRTVVSVYSYKNTIQGQTTNSIENHHPPYNSPEDMVILNLYVPINFSSICFYTYRDTYILLYIYI
jgi:hypothetical protein